MTNETKRRALAEPIRQFVAQSTGSQKRLLIDGTGPRVTMVLPYLTGAGEDALDQFDEIHAFSGGIYAYLIYRAYNLGCCQHSVEHYCQHLDKTIRRVHSLNPVSLLSMARNYARGKPLYSQPHYMTVVRYTFNETFLDASLDTVAPQLIPYVADKRVMRPLPVTSEAGFDRATVRIGELLEMSLKIPFLYGIEHDTPYYDATYAQGFIPFCRKLARQDDTLLLSMWANRNGPADKHVRIAPGETPQRRLRKDLLRLLLAWPNPSFRHDLQLAYGSD